VKYPYIIGVNNDGFEVWVFVELKDNMSLSIIGAEIDRASPGNGGSTGQINPIGDMQLWSDGWTPVLVDELNAIWERWHLNPMRAGSPDQEAYLRTQPRPPSPGQYDWIKEQLANVNLDPDPTYMGTNGRPYWYGSEWIEEELEPGVAGFLMRLPKGYVNDSEIPTEYM